MASAAVSAGLSWLCLQLAAVLLRYGFGVRQLVVGWVTVSVQTTAFNRLFYNLGRRHHNELRQWFGLGIVVAAMLGVSTAFILTRELWQAIKWADEASTVGGSGSASWMLSLAIPGMTVPWSHGIYLWLATAVSISVHEAGHALAAAAEGVGLHHLAAFTILLLPGAYVALDTETLHVLNPWRTLRIVCGGVWHNAVLCLLCWLAALLLPVLLWPAYSTGHGAVVRSVQEDSPLAQHLRQADMLTSVNGCPVRDGARWLGCMARLPGLHEDSTEVRAAADQLLELMGQPVTQQGAGYCVPHEAQAHSLACRSSADCGRGELCFQEHRSRGRRLGGEEADPGGGGGGGGSGQGQDSAGRELTVARREERGSCFQARRVVGFQSCGSAGGPGGAGSVRRCPSLSTCYVPVLPRAEELLKVCFKRGFNSPLGSGGGGGSSAQEAAGGRWLAAAGGGARRLAQAVVGPGDEGEAGGRPWGKPSALDRECNDFLVFVGSRASLLQAVEVSDYCPAAWWVPMRLPHVLEQLLAYTFAVSAALSLVNMAPVVGLDGEAALQALLRLWERGEAGGGRLGGGLRAGGRVAQHALIKAGTGVAALLLALHLLRLTGYDAPLMRLLAAVRHLLTFSVHWG